MSSIGHPVRLRELNAARLVEADNTGEPGAIHDGVEFVFQRLHPADSIGRN